jgi:phage tail sheath protein FI
MPTTFTYPGLYIEELPSGVHPIAGASTSDTAFVDAFSRGPVETPTRVTSFADFERTFGGLDAQSEASYALLQYYLNGGRNAWVVRIDIGNPGTASITLPSSSTSPATPALDVLAANPGAWGNRLEVAAVATVPTDPNRFNLFVRETTTVNGKKTVVTTEVHRGLSFNLADARYALAVVNETSQLVQLDEPNGSLGQLPALVTPNASGEPPDSAFQALAGGSDAALVDSSGVITGLSTAVLDAMRTLDRIDPFIFNLLCLPISSLFTSETDRLALLAGAETYCESKRAFLLVDPPPNVVTASGAQTWLAGLGGLPSPNAALYFPRLTIPDPLNGNRARDVGPSGTMAGVFARIDGARGVWKAPAGTEASLRGAGIAVPLTDDDSGALNPLGINALRDLAVFGPVAWGARTLFGADQRASEWKYVPVRRTALFIEDSLLAGLKWVVFEPNDETLWSQIRLNVGAFMQGLFRQGAFQGSTPREAYLVRCDATTTTQADIDRGVVNILVGFAPLKPAEFVLIQIQQLAGQTQT